jgi:uncharacterized cupredoxin-like copper-binding protein
MKKYLLAAALALVGTAFAHGDGRPGAANAAKTEQKKEQKDWGVAGEARAARRTIEVTMGDDMRFTPDLIEVKQGDVVKFKVRNKGALQHEFVLGTRQELDAHAALMLKFPDMEHDEPSMLHVAPGSSGELVWNFNRAGRFEFACLVAGHAQAGMVGKVNVIATRRK